jgi:hypothetical protein
VHSVVHREAEVLLRERGGAAGSDERERGGADDHDDPAAHGRQA